MANNAQGQTIVAVVLAVGLATAINVITAGILYDAIVNPGTAGISENATQILTGAFGGTIGVLGGFVGYQAGKRVGNAEAAEAVPDEDDMAPESEADGDGGPITREDEPQEGDY